MPEIVFGIAAVLITIIGVLLVAFMATLLYIGLLPLNYLWVLARTLRSVLAAKPAGSGGDDQEAADVRAGPDAAARPTPRAEPPPGYRERRAGSPGPSRSPRPGTAVWEPTVARRTPPPRKAPPKWPAEHGAAAPSPGERRGSPAQ